jgi:preprotein translocase subunit SecG
MLINVIQVVSAIILVIVILMQNRGAGLGSTFGGGGGGGGAYQTRRSTEKFVFNLTIIVAIIFFATAVINIFVIK